MDNRDAFAEWLSFQPAKTGDATGTSLKPRTVKNIIDSFDHLVNELKDISEEIEYRTPYAITNLSEFEKYEEIVKKSSYFENYNHKYSNGAPKQGMSRYKEFIASDWQIYFKEKASFVEQKKHAEQLDLHSLKLAAIQRSKKHVKATAYKTTSYQFQRDPYISQLVKMEANGKCQLCGKEAPFFDKNNKPYLESHHIEWLSEGGEDSIENTVALCPNCHRKMHIVNNDKDIEFLKSLTKDFR